MEKAKRMKLLWLCLAIFSSVSIAVGTPLLAYAALKGKYLLMSLLIAFVAHGFFTVAPYFIQLARERATLKLLPLVSKEGSISYRELASKCGLTAEGARLLTERAFKKGYIEL